MTHITRTSSSRDDWGTPQEIFDHLDYWYHFTLDPCASASNHKCKKYYTKENDGLSKSWAKEVVFCNPPYSNKSEWVTKCLRETLCGATCVCIIPDATDTKLWHEVVMQAKLIYFTKGRVKFIDPTNKDRKSNTRGTAIAVFSRHIRWSPEILSLDLSKI